MLASVIDQPLQPVLDLVFSYRRLAPFGRLRDVRFEATVGTEVGMMHPSVFFVEVPAAYLDLLTDDVLGLIDVVYDGFSGSFVLICVQPCCVSSNSASESSD